MLKCRISFSCKTISQRELTNQLKKALHILLYTGAKPCVCAFPRLLVSILWSLKHDYVSNQNYRGREDLEESHECLILHVRTGRGTNPATQPQLYFKRCCVWKTFTNTTCRKTGRGPLYTKHGSMASMLQVYAQVWLLHIGRLLQVWLLRIGRSSRQMEVSVNLWSTFITLQSIIPCDSWCICVNLQSVMGTIITIIIITKDQHYQWPKYSAWTALLSIGSY